MEAVGNRQAKRLILHLPHRYQMFLPTEIISDVIPADGKSPGDRAAWRALIEIKQVTQNTTPYSKQNIPRNSKVYYCIHPNQS